VPELEIGAWLQATEDVMKDAIYLPVKINAIERAVPAAQKER
jgi:hypothetical protein